MRPAPRAHVQVARKPIFIVSCTLYVCFLADCPTAGSLGVPSGNLDAPSLRTTHSMTEDPGSTYEPSVSAQDLARVASHRGPTTTVADDEDEDDFDDGSSHEVKPHSKDAFNITAQSAKLQLDLLTSVSAALRSEKDRNSCFVNFRSYHAASPRLIRIRHWKSQKLG